MKTPRLFISPLFGALIFILVTSIGTNAQQPVGSKAITPVVPDTFKPQFLITYVDYPGAEPYLEVIKEIYTELGFNVHTLPAPALRGLAFLSEEQVDADAFRLGRVATKFDNVILLKPELIRAMLVLLCRPEVSCDQAALINSQNTILTNERALMYLQDVDIHATLLKKEVIKDTVNMLRTKQVSYATYMFDERKIIPDDMQVLKLRSIFLYHLVQKKHAALVPLIEQKLRIKRAALDRKFAH